MQAKKTLVVTAALAMVTLPLSAATVLKNYQPGFRTIDGAQLNLMVGQVNSVNQTGMEGNYLIGGDATTNLFQRATTGASVTTTLTYGGPDRWAYWSGTNTAMTVSRDATAADLPTSNEYKYAFKMARTNGQTGVVQVCMAQEIETTMSLPLAGHTVELDFWATAGATFTPTGSQMAAYIIYGTGTDEGASKLAFGLNGGGGGGSGWTGQANAASPLVSISATPARYTVVGQVPSTATELGVALCFTPVGTAGANDYVALAGIQATRNDAQAGAAGSSGNVLTTNYSDARPFYFRHIGQETALQQRYYYQISEVTGPSPIGTCRARSTTVADCFIPFPVTMRAVPTVTYTSPGFATETTAAGGTLGACNTLAASVNVASTVASLNAAMAACTATTVPAAGVADYLWNNGGSGAMKANAEL